MTGPLLQLYKSYGPLTYKCQQSRVHGIPELSSTEMQNENKSKKKEKKKLLQSTHYLPFLFRLEMSLAT